MEQFVLMIYQGTTPLPGADEWTTLPTTSRPRSTPTTERSTNAGVTTGPRSDCRRRAHRRVEDGTERARPTGPTSAVTEPRW